MDPAVNPAASPFNPSYSLGGPITGSNSINLTSSQIPSHTHANTLTFTNPDHTHFTVGGNTSDSPVTAGTSIANAAALGGNSSYQLAQGAVPAVAGLTSPSKSDLSITLTNVAAGGSLPHANNQPALACYYIMYIP
jgi:microcystin-dependent protein